MNRHSAFKYWTRNLFHYTVIPWINNPITFIQTGHAEVSLFFWLLLFFNYHESLIGAVRLFTMTSYRHSIVVSQLLFGSRPPFQPRWFAYLLFSPNCNVNKRPGWCVEGFYQSSDDRYGLRFSFVCACMKPMKRLIWDNVERQSTPACPTLTLYAIRWVYRIHAVANRLMRAIRYCT